MKKRDNNAHWEALRLALAWTRIRNRSLSTDGKMCCADCYFSFYMTGFACAKHIRPHEREQLDEQLRKMACKPHPFFEMCRKAAAR